MIKPKAKKPLLPTPGEMRLLHALWTLGEGTVEQIVNSFPATEQPNYKTTHTLLRIMESKGFLRHTSSGKTFIFAPTVLQQDVASASVRTLLKQNFGGSASGLLLNLLESDSLRGSDLREMEDLIRKYRETKDAEETA